MLKWPRLKRDRVGMHVRVVQTLQNHYWTIPAGAEMTVTSWTAAGCRLAGDTCPCCGIRPHISRVHESRLAPVALPEGPADA